MAKSSTTITKNTKMPPRGRGAKTLILETLRENALLSLDESATKEEAEKAVFKFLAEAAFNPTRETAFIANTALSTLMKKGWPDVKSCDQVVEFNYTEGSTPSKKADQIMKAISNGKVPPNIGIALLSGLLSAMKITEISEFDQRLTAIEDRQRANA